MERLSDGRRHAPRPRGAAVNAAPHPHIDPERGAEAYAEVQRLLDAHDDMEGEA